MDGGRDNDSFSVGGSQKEEDLGRLEEALKREWEALKQKSGKIIVVPSKQDLEEQKERDRKLEEARRLLNQFKSESISKRGLTKLQRFGWKIAQHLLYFGNPNLVKLPEEEEIIKYIKEFKFGPSQAANEFILWQYLWACEVLGRDRARPIIEDSMKSFVASDPFQTHKNGRYKLPNNQDWYCTEVRAFQAALPMILKDNARKKRENEKMIAWKSEARRIGKYSNLSVSGDLAKELYGASNNHTKARVRKKMERLRKKGYI